VDLGQFLTDVETRAAGAVAYYEKSSPVVSRWADDLYVRLNEDIYSVTMREIRTLDALFDEAWSGPNLAQNQVYKCLEAQGQAIGVLGW